VCVRSLPKRGDRCRVGKAVAVAVAVAVAPFLNSVLVAEEERRRGKNEKKSMTKNSSENQLTPIMQGKYGSRWYRFHDNKRLGSQIFQTSLCK